ncbi:hypothetical protein QBC32DRAFT_315355 [Pseudoneurospora amorphoporcata]|uniref:Uncharacterized protein n=1 Tax=Pseudoneurospora amorphoporcata TaxID=241081 RepID=A0AAN6NW52_9PEZI|nr:hypothetical protein QBC32DRAFT_315355 [Pseudoneurospora amorphoporcata]
MAHINALLGTVYAWRLRRRGINTADQPTTNTPPVTISPLAASLIDTEGNKAPDDMVPPSGPMFLGTGGCPAPAGVLHRRECFSEPAVAYSPSYVRLNTSLVNPDPAGVLHQRECFSEPAVAYSPSYVRFHTSLVNPDLAGVLHQRECFSEPVVAYSPLYVRLNTSLVNMPTRTGLPDR